jgi:hypothetical protein
MKPIAMLALCVLAAAQAGAETYSWVDDQGTYNFTEDLSRVPKKYRGNTSGMMEGTSPQHVQEDSVPPRKESGAGPDTQQVTSPPVGKTDAEVPSEEKMYGGKPFKTWRAEADSLEAELKSLETRLQQLKSQAKTAEDLSAYRELLARYDQKYAEYSNTIDAAQKAGLTLRKK